MMSSAVLGMSKEPKGLQRIAVKRLMIEDMLQTMRDFGAHGWEVLVLWLGEVDTSGKVGKVVQAFVPKQKPISSEDGVGYFVDGQTLFQLNRELSQTGLRLIAQVHSHPTEAYHSDADDRYAIVTVDGGLSLVVPDFGRAEADPKAWAVYRLQGARWQEVGKREVETLFEIVD
jgi:hypothetical protein